MKSEKSKELSTKEVAARYDVERRSVRNWCVQGLLPGAHMVETERGPLWKIPESALVNFVPPKPGRVPRSKQVPAQEKSAA